MTWSRQWLQQVGVLWATDCANYPFRLAVDMAETLKTKILNYKWLGGLKTLTSREALRIFLFIYIDFNERAAISREDKVLHLISRKKWTPCLKFQQYSRISISDRPLVSEHLPYKRPPIQKREKQKERNIKDDRCVWSLSFVYMFSTWIQPTRIGELWFNN